MISIGIDTGGTHTDIVLFHKKSNKLYVAKVATSRDLINGILEGIISISQSSGIEPNEIKDFCYGTTIVTNIIVQKEKKKIALITTKGFRDLLEIGNASREWNIYDIQENRVEPLISREFRKGVTERINFKGEIIVKLDENEARETVRDLNKKGIESIAVAFLHSYQNPIHEKRVKDIIKEENPNIYVTLSSEISPEFREYPRISTTVLNAFAQPTMESHLDLLSKKLREKNINCSYNIMQSQGGLISFRRAKEKPITVGGSGPIAGVLAGRYFGNLAGFSNIITFDIGGTSADVTVIENNQLKFTAGGSTSLSEGYPTQIPSVEYNTVGAGGGSIIWIDKGGLLKVGPKSAGSNPGPVCYDQGGESPTLTDAFLVDGILNDEAFLGGKKALNKEKAKHAIRQLANKSGLSIGELTNGAIKIAVSKMSDAIKSFSIQKGIDLRDHALVAFGGGGPMFAAMVADEMGLPVVVIPYNPGVGSAFGLLLADIKHGYSITRIVTEDMISVKDVNDIFSNLEKQAIEEFEQEGINTEKVVLTRTVDLRYRGQSYELNIPVDNGKLDNNSLDLLRTRFNKKHQEIYGHHFDDRLLQYVNFRLTGVLVKSKPQIKRDISPSTSSATKVMSRDVSFDNNIFKTNIFKRDNLRPGDIINGPAIIEQMDTTTVLLPKNYARINQTGNILIFKRGDN